MQTSSRLFSLQSSSFLFLCFAEVSHEIFVVQLRRDVRAEAQTSKFSFRIDVFFFLWVIYVSTISVLFQAPSVSSSCADS